LNSGDDARVGAGAVFIEDFDGHEVGFLGDAVGAACDGAGAVSAVPVLVGVLLYVSLLVAGFSNGKRQEHLRESQKCS